MVRTHFIVAALSTLPLALATYPAAYPPAPGTEGPGPEGPKGDGPSPPRPGDAGYQSPPNPDHNSPAPNGTNYPPPPPPPPGHGKGKETHVVAVGQNGLTFTPNTVYANVGDEVVFKFFPKNHTVVRADFNDPCNPMKGKDGLFSGFNFAVANGTAEKTFTVQVKDDKPQWLYCSQNQPKPHCAAGMVAVINPPPQGPNTLEGFKAAAAKTTKSTSPEGGAFGGEVTGGGAMYPPPGPPGAPSPPDAPMPSTAPDAPGAPYAPGAPNAPSPPGAPSAPGAPSPGAPSSPGAPGAPGAPSSTLVPGAPLAPTGTGSPIRPSTSPTQAPAQFEGAAGTVSISSALAAMALLVSFLM